MIISALQVKSANSSPHARSLVVMVLMVRVLGQYSGIQGSTVRILWSGFCGQSSGGQGSW